MSIDIDQAGGPTCPAPMTRAELLALRNAGSLDTGCRYTITDPPAAGNFAPTALVFDAVSATELSREGDAVVAWTSNPVTVWYDIDANGYNRAVDVVRNDVRGSHAQIGQFPWGVANVYGNTLIDVTLTYVSGLFYQNEITSATVTVNNTFIMNKIDGTNVLQGAGAGAFYRNSVAGGSTITMGPANVFQNEFFIVSAVNFSGSVGNVRYCKFQSASTMTVTNVAQLDWAYMVFQNAAFASISGAARSYGRSATFDNTARLLQSSGTQLDINTTDFNGGGYVQVSAGRLYLNNNRIDTNSYIQNNTAGTNRVAQCNVHSNSRIRFLGTSNNNQVYYNTVSDGSYIELRNATTGTNFYYCSVTSNSGMYADGSINGRFYYSSATASSFIYSQGMTGTHYIYYCQASARGYIQILSGSGGYFYALDVSAQAIVRVTGGTAASRLYYSTISAYFYLYLTGTTLSTTRYGWHATGRLSYTPTTMPPNGTPQRNF